MQDVHGLTGALIEPVLIPDTAVYTLARVEPLGELVRLWFAIPQAAPGAASELLVVAKLVMPAREYRAMRHRLGTYSEARAAIAGLQAIN